MTSLWTRTGGNSAEARSWQSCWGAAWLGRTLCWKGGLPVVRNGTTPSKPLTPLGRRKGVIPESFRSKYDVLTGIRNDLEKLSITQAWSLRETDLYDFQRQLDKIDEERVDGNWLDQDGKPAELYVQRTLLYLIRRSYGYIYYLMNSSEPVSEALLPIYNQLQTLKRCLVEVKNSGGVGSVRELYPYSMKVCLLGHALGSRLLRFADFLRPLS